MTIIRPRAPGLCLKTRPLTTTRIWRNQLMANSRVGVTSKITSLGTMETAKAIFLRCLKAVALSYPWTQVSFIKSTIGMDSPAKPYQEAVEVMPCNTKPQVLTTLKTLFRFKRTWTSRKNRPRRKIRLVRLLLRS